MKQCSLEAALVPHISRWQSGTKIQLINFQIDFFISIYRARAVPSVLVYPDDVFDDVLRYCSVLLGGRDVVCVPPRSYDQKTPDGFTSKQKQQHDRAVSLFASGVGAVSFVLCAQSSLSAEIVSTSEGGLCFSSGVDFEGCVAFLNEQGFSIVDIVKSPGEFALRGGIVDVFPWSNTEPFRISFLDESISIYNFNINTQITTLSVNDLFIPNTHKKSLSSIESALQDSFVFLFYGSLGFSVFHDELNINDLCQTINHGDFIKLNKNKNSCLVDENLSSFGLVFSGEKIVVPPWFVGRRVVIKAVPSRKVAQPVRLSTIRCGDFLVHRDHGVGVCLGLSLLDREGGQEFLSIKYGDGGIIRIDSGRLDLVDYYAPSDAEGVVLDSLSKKSSWKRKYNSAKKSAEKTVDRLLKLYVHRGSINKKPLYSGGSLESRFISDFPYTETEDQLSAWKEISKDLSSDKLMDRLLCGDVGFGKTELAMRAAFRCVVGGRRVIVLAPTTILASQLYRSFNSRLGAHAINIDMVSRLCSKKDVCEVLNRVALGNNDVLVGTHALLNNNMYLKNIGLLVVDEEHRFGVRHKEKIKSYKNNIDVLSMSATPIPRSMNLALSGISSISLLQTPPLMRRPIITRVNYYDELLIKRAILYEVGSGGQVFFIHNKVQNIDLVVDRLSRLLPKLQIISMHGQESPRIIENKMNLFSTKRVHVLVCTSIIEAGIDVPSANCLIINNVHQFGLSQLYQMRGRVGRSNKQAHAYMLIPKGVRLSNKAYRRIKAIEENSHLGAGYNIAMSDMNIRGSGHLFGYRQSGSGGSVGYEMYMRLIQRSLHAFKGGVSSFSVLPEDVLIKIYKDRYIPEQYIKSESVRLSFYKAISSAPNKEAIDDVCNNIQNRFGGLPSSINNLIKESLLRLQSAACGVSSIVQRGCGVVCEIKNVNGALVFPAFIDYMDVFFKKKNISFHILPKSHNVLLVCIHLLNYKDKYSLLSEFLNKFKLVK